MSIELPHVETLGKISAQEFHDDVVPAAVPVVFKGQVADWPAVQAAQKSDRDIVDYITRFDSGSTVDTIIGPPAIEGRFFYNESMSGLNFTRRPARIGDSLVQILDQADAGEPESVYIESMPIADRLPGFGQENALGLLDTGVEARIWIGNRITVQTHFDLRENVACVAAGRRRFTLFPPSQTPNLYPGPFELTLSGPPVSMVQLDEVDHDRFPRFRTALEHALVAELEPGDALYIPYFWWHHVRALEDVNVLVNYWWNEAPAELGSPFDAMLHAILSIRDMPERQRKAWKTMFDTYVFGEFGDPVEHLPAGIRGPLGDHDEELRQRMRMLLIASLGKQAGIRPPNRQ
jgi:hypothetical protein